MTVKDVVGLLKTAKTIALCWDGSSYKLERSNALMMDAYGNYVVDYIQAIGNEDEAYYEVNIAMRPVKEGGV